MDIIYCGSIAQVADEIYLSDWFNLSFIFVEPRAINSDLIEFSLLRNIVIIEVINSSEIENFIDDNGLRESCLLMCGFGIILKESLLEKVNVFNIHFGELPNYKGRHPMFYSINEGQKYIMTSLHCVEIGIDEGEVISEYKKIMRFRSYAEDVFGEIDRMMFSHLNKLAMHLRVEELPKVQKESCYYPPVKEDQVVLASSSSAQSILRMSRSQRMHGGFVLMHKERFHKVKDTRVVFSNDGPGTVGDILEEQEVPKKRFVHKWFQLVFLYE